MIETGRDLSAIESHDQKNEDAQIEEPSVLPLQYGIEDYWTWNKLDKSKEVRVYGVGYRIAHFHCTWSSGTAGVRANKILNNRRYYWELALGTRLFGTSMMFGIGTKKARIHSSSFINLLGVDDNSWGLSHKGQLWHCGKQTQYTKPFRENRPTTIGVYFDGITGTLTYYKDGRSLGTAFTGLDKVTEPLYPMVTSTAAKTEMILCNMKREFFDLQDRCRAVVMKGIKTRAKLDQLRLPKRLNDYLAESLKDEPLPFAPLDKFLTLTEYQY